MKKIALLLTGQLRTIDVLKYLHMNTLISKYDTDVFLGIDLDNSLQCLFKNSTIKTNDNQIKSAIEFFKPIEYYILDNFEDEFLNIQKKTKIYVKWFKLVFRQYFVVYNTYKMLKKHIEKTKTNYDIIIRLRFDQFICTDLTLRKEICYTEDENMKLLWNDETIKKFDDFSKQKILTFNEIEDNTLYLLGYGKFQHYNYANDQFFYHNMSLINTLLNFYENILTLYEHCLEIEIGNKGALIECIFYLYLTNNNISLKLTHIHGFFIREKYIEYKI
jgi:hypothetical protein